MVSRIVSKASALLRRLLSQSRFAKVHPTFSAFPSLCSKADTGACCPFHRALSSLPRRHLCPDSSGIVNLYQRASLPSSLHLPQELFAPLSGLKGSGVIALTGFSFPHSLSTMSHSPHTSSEEPVIAEGEDEQLVKERLKRLIEIGIPSSADGLWSLSTDRMGIERHISFRTFKLCWVCCTRAIGP